MAIYVQPLKCVPVIEFPYSAALEEFWRYIILGKTKSYIIANFCVRVFTNMCIGSRLRFEVPSAISELRSSECDAVWFAR